MVDERLEEAGHMGWLQVDEPNGGKADDDDGVEQPELMSSS